MTILIWVLGAMAIQLVLTVFIVRFIRVGKTRRALEGISGFDVPPLKVPESDRPVPMTRTYEELSALLTALSPRPDGEAATTLADPVEAAPQSDGTGRPGSTLSRPAIRG